MSSNRPENPNWINDLLSEIAAADGNAGFAAFFETPADDKVQNKKDVVLPTQGLLLPGSSDYQRYLEEFSIRMTEDDGIYDFKYRVGDLFSGNRAVIFTIEENDTEVIINEAGQTKEDWRSVKRQEYFVRQTTVKKSEAAGLADVVKLTAFNFSNHRGLDLQIGKLGYPHLANIYYLNFNLFQGAGITNEDLTDFSHGVSKKTLATYPLLINDIVWLKNKSNTKDDRQSFLTITFRPEFFGYSVTNIPVSAGLIAQQTLEGRYNEHTNLPNSDNYFRVDADFSNILRKDIDVRLMGEKRGINDPHIRVNAGKEAYVQPVISQLMRHDSSFDRVFGSLPIQTIIKASDLKLDFSLNT